MTSGSAITATAPGPQLTPLAKGQEEKNHLLRHASAQLLTPLNNDPGTAAPTTSRGGHGEAESEGVQPAPFKTTERGS